MRLDCCCHSLMSGSHCKGASHDHVSTHMRSGMAQVGNKSDLRHLRQVQMEDAQVRLPVSLLSMAACKPRTVGLTQTLHAAGHARLSRLMCGAVFCSCLMMR